MVGYVICLHGLCEKMEEVLVGDQLWDLKSDHKPIYLCFSWIGKKTIRVKNSACPTKSPMGQNSFDLKKL